MSTERILGIILGAGDFVSAGLSGGPSFRNSARDFRSYLLSATGLKLDSNDVLDLFDTKEEASIILSRITEFLQQRWPSTCAPPATLFAYYVGHGGFTPNGEDYFLAVRSTRKEMPWASGIRMRDLAHAIRNFARFQRRYIILDCCFSGQASRILQSAPAELAALKTQESLPTKGTSVLCSSGPKQPSLAPENLRHTMFSEAFLQVLNAGEPNMGSKLTFREIRSLVERELRKRWGSDLVRPEIHSPDQADGDISDFPIFPNPVYRPLAEHKELTVMFSDIRGFTTVSEKADPLELFELLNEYLNAMTDVLAQNSGTLDKFIGESIMAFWGAPNPQRDHAYRACCCALDMLVREEQLRRKWQAQGKPYVATGLGLSSGRVAVGSLGSERRRSLTVIGETVNLASRLEGLNRDYGTHIIVNESTYAEAKDCGFVFRELDLIRVKGKLQPVTICELVGRTGEDSVYGPPEEVRKRLELFQKARALYCQRQWQSAQDAFQSILDQWPGDGPSRAYWKRCQEYLLVPPPESWDGVFVATRK